MEKEGIIIIASICIVFGFIIFGGLMMNKYSCLRGYENFQPEWGVISGCRVVVDGKLTPVDIVRELK